MNHVKLILLAVVICVGCGRGNQPETSNTQDPLKDLAESSVDMFPRLEWTEPLPEETQRTSEYGDYEITEVSGATEPANLITLQKCFQDEPWRNAPSPRFTVWLNDAEYCRITIDRDSEEIVGKVRTCKPIEDGLTLQQTRTTKPISDQQQAIALLEAYMRQDGTFDEVVNWKE